MKRVLEPSMNASISNWSLNKDRGRRRGGSEVNEDEDFMHARGVRRSPTTSPTDLQTYMAIQECLHPRALNGTRLSF